MSRDCMYSYTRTLTSAAASPQILFSLFHGTSWSFGVLRFMPAYEGKENEFEINNSTRW